MLVLIGAIVGAITAAVAAFVPWLPEQASVQRERIDFLFWLTTWIAVGIWALVAAVILYAVFKFRARPDDDSDGPPIHGHTGLEIVWTAVPTVLVVVIGVASAVVLWRNDRAAADALVVRVTGQQFAWTFEYPDGTTSGTLGLPVGRDVVLDLGAREVIHSFWVAEFGQKQDAVPGIRTRVVITPTRRGTFPVICTELCGLGHAAMRARAVVVSSEGFEQWVAEQRRAAEAGAAVQGKQLFTQQCGSCHALADAGTTGETGPNLDNVLRGKNAEYVREQIVNPDSIITPGFQPVMPKDFGERLSDPQINSLVEYLVSVAGGR